MFCFNSSSLYCFYSELLASGAKQNFEKVMKNSLKSFLGSDGDLMLNGKCDAKEKQNAIARVDGFSGIKYIVVNHPHTHTHTHTHTHKSFFSLSHSLSFLLFFIFNVLAFFWGVLFCV